VLYQLITAVDLLNGLPSHIHEALLVSHIHNPNALLIAKGIKVFFEPLVDNILMPHIINLIHIELKCLIEVCKNLAFRLDASTQLSIKQVYLVLVIF
jgi:hypothetical protein